MPKQQVKESEFFDKISVEFKNGIGGGDEIGILTLQRMGEKPQKFEVSAFDLRRIGEKAKNVQEDVWTKRLEESRKLKVKQERRV